MVATLILALAVILSFQALWQARQVAGASEEIRSAKALLGELLDNGPRTFDLSQGVIRQFSWTVETQTTGADRPVAVCRRVVSLKSNTSSRQYSISTLEACPAEEAG